jgi:hypothetical protein
MITMTEVIEMKRESTEAQKAWKPRHVYYVYSIGPPVRTYWCPTCEDLGKWAVDKKLSFFCILEECNLSAAIEKFVKFEPGEVFCDECVGHMGFHFPTNNFGSDEFLADVYIGVALPYDVENEIGRILIDRGVFNDDNDDWDDEDDDGMDDGDEL